VVMQRLSTKQSARIARMDTRSNRRGWKAESQRNRDVMSTTQERFIHAQGFRAGSIDFYRALKFQPKIVGSLVLMGACLGNAWLFLILSMAMWWSTLAPTGNVFDAVYNSVVAYPRGLPPLVAAPAPRRFAMGMAASLALLIAGALFLRASVIAWVFEAVFFVAVLLVLAHDFCLGAWVYHLLHPGDGPKCIQ